MPGTWNDIVSTWNDVSTKWNDSGSVTLDFPMAIADTSAVLALGLEVGQHFPVQIVDTSVVTALGLEIGVRIPLTIADTSTILALGFHILAPLGFPVHIADTSSVLALGYRITRRFNIQIADTSSVLALGFHQILPHFPLVIVDSSSVLALGFENDHAVPPAVPLIVPPYAGQDQEILIDVPAWIAYKYIDWEEGPWVMPPYAWFYPPPAGPPPPAPSAPAPCALPLVRRIRWVASGRQVPRIGQAQTVRRPARPLALAAPALGPAPVSRWSPLPLKRRIRWVTS